MYLNRDENALRNDKLRSRGFNGLIENVVAVAQTQKTLLEAARIVLTLDGRISDDDAELALTETERHLLTQNGHRKIHPVPGTASDDDRSDVYIGISPTGRLGFMSGGHDHEKLTAFGRLAIDDSHSCAEQNAKSSFERSAVLLRELSSGWDQEKLHKMLDRVEFAIDHIDPVVLYVESDMFTNFDSSNNLLGRAAVKSPGYLLTDLRGKALSNWTLAEKMLVASIDILAQANIRVEEFNGQQINLELVGKLLLDRHLVLCELTGVVPSEVALFERPKAIVKMRDAVRSSHFAYRLVNGLSFNKHQHLMRRDAVDLSVKAIPESITNMIVSACGVMVGGSDTIDSYFSRVVEKIFFASGPSGEGLTFYEELLKIITSSAIRETGSDIGMTRGLRDFRGWARLFREKRYAELCGMPPTNYYCAVFASPDTEQYLRSEDMYNKVLAAIAGRMTFNSWHYTPGHVPKSEIPVDRHYYVPPKMSDLAVWSDQHHQGHVLAQVRYSIRSPGGLIVNGIKQHGTFDLRLMRRDGSAFEIADLLTARRHTACLRAVIQAALDFAGGDENAQTVRAFTKEWYKNA